MGSHFGEGPDARSRRLVWYGAGIGVASIGFSLLCWQLIRGGILGFPDLVPFPPSPATGFTVFYSPWSVSGFGSPNAQGNLVFGMSALELMLGPVGAQHAFFLALIPLSGISMYFYSRKLLGGLWLPSAVAVAYAFNPFSIGQFDAGEGSLLFYALLPLILASWSAAIFSIDRPTMWKNIVWLTCLSSVSWAVYVNGSVVLALLFVLLLIPISITRNIGVAFRGLLVSSITIGASLILNVRVVLSTIFQTGTALASSSSFLAATQQVYSTEIPTPLNAVSLLSSVTIGAVVLALISIGVLLKRQTPGKELALLEFSFAAITLSMLMWGVGTGLLLPAFSWPPIVTFRDPHTPEYVMPVLLLSAVGLSAKSVGYAVAGLLVRAPRISRIVNVTRSRKGFVRSRPAVRVWYSAGSAVLVGAIVLALLPVQAAPALSSGNLGLVPQQNYQFERFSYSPFVPAGIENAYDWLSNRGYDSNTFNVLWLPLSYYSSTRTVWYDAIDEGALTGFSYSVSQNFTRTLSAFFNDSSSPMGDLLSIVSVEYVVIDLTSPFSGPIQVYSPSLTEAELLGYYPLDVVGSPQSFVDYFASSPQFSQVFSDSGVAIFSNDRYSGLVSADSRLAIVLPNDVGAPTLVLGSGVIQDSNFSSGLASWYIARNVSINSSATGVHYAQMQESATITQFNLAVEANTTYKIELNVSGPLQDDWTTKLLWFNRSVSVPTASESLAATYIVPSGNGEGKFPVTFTEAASAPPESKYVSLTVYAGGPSQTSRVLDVYSVQMTPVYSGTDGRNTSALDYAAYSSEILTAIPLFNSTGFVGYPMAPTEGMPDCVTPSVYCVYTDGFPTSTPSPASWLVQRASDVLTPVTSNSSRVWPYVTTMNTVGLPSNASMTDSLDFPAAGNWVLLLTGGRLGNLSISFGTQKGNNVTSRPTVATTSGISEYEEWNLSLSAAGNHTLVLHSNGNVSLSWIALVPSGFVSNRVLAPEVWSTSNALASSGSIDFEVTTHGWTDVIVRQRYDPAWLVGGVNSSVQIPLIFGSAIVIYGEGNVSITFHYSRYLVDRILVVTESVGWVLIGGLVVATLLPRQVKERIRVGWKRRTAFNRPSQPSHAEQPVSSDGPARSLRR